MTAVPGITGSLFYHVENRLTSSAGVTYTYDGDSRRVKKSNRRLYWYGVEGQVLQETTLTGTLVNEYVFFAGRRTARRNGSGTVFYYFEDHLGSSRVTVQAGQTTKCYDADFLPYGYEKVYTNTCPQNYKFTGKERDAESGLDYFIARHYSPGMGRFLQADSLTGKVEDPHSWNLYAYSLANPVRCMDPNGHELKDYLLGFGNA